MFKEKRLRISTSSRVKKTVPVWTGPMMPSPMILEVECDPQTKGYHQKKFTVDAVMSHFSMNWVYYVGSFVVILTAFQFNGLFVILATSDFGSIIETEFFFFFFKEIHVLLFIYL